MWEFAGGKVEAGETQPEALIRELQEELGIVALPGQYVASHQREVSQRLIHLHAWHVPAFSGELTAHYHSALVWCTPEEAFSYPLAPCNQCCIYQDQNYSEGAVVKADGVLLQCQRDERAISTNPLVWRRVKE